LKQMDNLEKSLDRPEFKERAKNMGSSRSLYS